VIRWQLCAQFSVWHAETFNVRKKWRRSNLKSIQAKSCILRRVWVELPRPSICTQKEANAFSLWNDNLGYQGILEWIIRFHLKWYNETFYMNSCWAIQSCCANIPVLHLNRNQKQNHHFDLTVNNNIHPRTYTVKYMKICIKISVIFQLFYNKCFIDYTVLVNYSSCNTLNYSHESICSDHYFTA
jgi:hypothetical protein